MQPKSIAIVGAAETTRLGVIPDMSQIRAVSAGPPLSS
jgi:hypothetical protein